mgnify:FL=1
MGLCNSLFWPTAHAFVQELVEQKDYFSANALLSASYQVGSILGAGVGGFIAGRAYPAVRKKAEKGLRDLQQKWEKEDAQTEQSEPSSEG